MTKENTIVANNNKANFQYFILDKYKTGLVLTGTEVKSVRSGGKVNLGEAYCFFRKNELWIKNMHIAPYAHGSYNNHEPRRERKLLLTKRELKRLLVKIKERGLTIIPLEMYISERGFIKLDIGLAKGKKSFDKRDTIQQRDQKRDLDRLRKHYK
ncbi:MAG: SsrA-binding protein SmpB [Bacteroidetes bacterium]|nr:SsrA-binding protein SmpB [Bacteroidota bacterium]